MKQGKFAAPVRRRRRRNTLKPMLIAMAVVLLLGCVTGGTLAWLTATTTPVTNTFTTSDIKITLEESDNLDLKMIPGWTITKDPKVTVLTGSEDCYLFVKVEKSGNFDSFMTYDMADGWTQLKDASKADVPGVFYREISSTGMGAPISVLKGDQVTVKDNVTKTMMNNLTTGTYPTLTFTAYASQLHKNGTDNFTPIEAWNNVNSTT